MFYARRSCIFTATSSIKSCAFFLQSNVQSDNNKKQGKKFFQEICGVLFGL